MATVVRRSPGRPRFPGLDDAQHHQCAAELGAARVLCHQLGMSLQYPWGVSSSAVKCLWHMERAIDGVRSALDGQWYGTRAVDDPPQSPYYPEQRLLPAAITAELAHRLGPPLTRHFTALLGDALLERLEVLRHLLDRVTDRVLGCLGATHPTYQRLYRLWAIGGALGRTGLAIEREWFRREQAGWAQDAQTAFLRRLYSLPAAGPIPPVWQVWLDALAARKAPPGEARP